MFSPPYMRLVRPNFSGAPANILYGAIYTLSINVLSSAKVVQAVIMDLGESKTGCHARVRSAFGTRL